MPHIVLWHHVPKFATTCAFCTLAAVNKSLTAADKTLIVLEAAIAHPRFTDVVNATGFPKATVHRLIQTLLDYEYIGQSEVGDYFPGPALLKLGGTALNSIDISQAAEPHLRRLVDRTGLTVHLGGLVKTEAIYLSKIEGVAPYHIPSGVGQSLMLHTTAIGKSILAFLPTNDVAEVAVAAGLPARTPNSITSLAELQQELKCIKSKGYCFDNEENVPGIRCIGAPVKARDGHVKYAISMTALAMEKSIADLEEYASLVLEAADGVSHAIGAS